MKKHADMKIPELVIPPNLHDPLQQHAEVLKEVAGHLKESQQSFQSLRLLVLALADTAQDMPSLVRAYRVRLGEYERLTGKVLPPSIPVD